MGLEMGEKCIQDTFKKCESALDPVLLNINPLILNNFFLKKTQIYKYKQKRKQQQQQQQ